MCLMTYPLTACNNDNGVEEELIPDTGTSEEENKGTVNIRITIGETVIDATCLQYSSIKTRNPISRGLSAWER